jgi:putative alpha-1,2-mannosidase
MDAMGGDTAAIRRLDALFHNDDGSWALTRLGGLKAEMDNEPSVLTPWLYLFAGRADRTQATVREALNRLWSDRPDGIPGNDDLGAMSSWFVWAAMGMYPAYPGRAELLLASPLFRSIEIRRAAGAAITIRAEGAGADAPYVGRLTVNGRAATRPWLPESFVQNGGSLAFTLGASPTRWGSRPEDSPPSFPPRRS